MSFREMVLQRGESDMMQEQETVLAAIMKNQSPMMLGLLGLMGLNFLFLMISFHF